MEVACFQIDDREEKLDKIYNCLLESQAKVVQHPRLSKGSRDYCPTMWENKAFQFVADPSLEHLSKMAKSLDSDCTVVKFLMVPASSCGIVHTMHIPKSVAKQQLYKVTINDFPACKCLNFIFMKSYTLTNSQKKWIYCKHIYFIFQRLMGCTKDDKFIHCPTYTFNEVIMLLDRTDTLSSTD